MARNDPEFRLRLPPELKIRMEQSAQANKRSLNAEILVRLERSDFGYSEALQMRELLRTTREEIAATNSKLATLYERHNALRKKDKELREKFFSFEKEGDEEGGPSIELSASPTPQSEP